MEFLGITSIPFVLTSSLVAGVIAQAIKVLLKLRRRAFSLELIDAYGGMPSAHSAFLFALLTSIAIVDGIGSTGFAIAAIMTAIMVRDALGFRMILEEHGTTIAELAKTVLKTHPTLKKRGHYRIGHRVGHTVPEIIVGTAIGIVVSIALWYPYAQYLT